MKMPTPSFGGGEEDRKKSRRPINVNTSTFGPALTPNTAQGGQGNGQPISTAERSLMWAQNYVNERFPHTTTQMSQRQQDRNQAVADEGQRYRNGDTAPRQQGQGQQNQKPTQEQRDQMAFYQGQLWALQQEGRAPEDMQFIEVNAEKESEYKAWQEGQDSVQAMLIEERRQNEAAYNHGSAFQNVASMEPMKLPTDQLSKNGEQIASTSYAANGQPLTHSYRVDGASIIHTDPKGVEQKMTVAESKVHQAERQDAITRNTANALEGMKADPSVTFRQGEHTFSVQGKDIVRTDAEGKEAGRMPLAKFEANLRERQGQCAQDLKTTQADLQKERKEHASIKDALTNIPSNGKEPSLTANGKFGPTTWKLDQNGELQGEPNKFKAAEKMAEQDNSKGLTGNPEIDAMTNEQAKTELQAHNAFVQQQRQDKAQTSGTDLNAATDRFAAGENARNDAKAVSGIGKQTIVERLRDKPEGEKLTHTKTGDTYSLQGTDLVRHDKDGNETLRKNADEAHKEQKAHMEAKAAERDKDQTK